MNPTTCHAQEPIAGLLATDHCSGSPRAAVWLLEYGDYESPACGQAEPITRRLVATYGSRLRYVYRHFPMVEDHPHAEQAAEAAEAAAAQHQFWQMHHELFKHGAHLKPYALTRCAEAIGLDMQRYHAEMADRIYTQRVQEHRRSGEALGLRGSPCFFLNGQRVDVSFGLEHLEPAVRAALDRPRGHLPRAPHLTAPSHAASPSPRRGAP